MCVHKEKRYTKKWQINKLPEIICVLTLINKPSLNSFIFNKITSNFLQKRNKISLFPRFKVFKVLALIK